MKYEKQEDLNRYMKDVNRYSLITPQKEKELSRIIHGKSSTMAEKLKAKNELILGNLKLVVKIAIKIYYRFNRVRDTHMNFMDYIQAGNIGLMRAADLFVVSKHCKFSSYASVVIERRIMRAVHESKFVRMPIKYYRYIYDLENIEREKGKNLSDEYLAKKLNIVQSTLKNIKQNRYSMGHVDRWDGFGSDEIPVDQIVDCQDLKEYMFSKIKELSPKQREVLYLTFFSNDIPTLQKTGQKLGISKQAVRMLIVYALRNLKRKIKKEFKSFELENKNKGEKT